ncbi:MAG: PAS domain-containing protein, partial [Anaerolineales bacterium]
MLTKQLHNRLESLFSDLEQEVRVPDRNADQTVLGWTWECDAQGIYTDCSPEVENILGLSAAEFKGNSLTAFMLSGSSTETLKSTLESGEVPIAVDIQFRSKNGELIPVSLHILNSTVGQSTD